LIKEKTNPDFFAFVQKNRKEIIGSVKPLRNSSEEQMKQILSQIMTLKINKYLSKEI
jgi:hypothetical protein